VTQNPVKDLHSQVTVLNSIEELDALDIMEKLSDALFFTECREAGLTKMPVGNMADVMSERNGFNQVFVQAEASSNRSCDFGNQLDMNDAVRDMVIVHE
jgi:hypothetical protein